MGKEKKNDLTLKIFSLIIAIILWSYVMSEVNPPKTQEIRNISVNLLNKASLERKGLVLLEPEEIDIRVSISGRTSDVIGVSKDDIIAQVDLSGYNEGEVKVPIYVQVPTGVVLEDYSPKEVLFKFDKIDNEEIPITVNTAKDLPSGYVLGTPTVRPQSVVVEGPRTLLNSVSKAIASVDVSDSTDDINVTVPIRLVDDEGNSIRGASTNISVVDISIPVYKVKSVPIELQTTNQLPENYEIIDVNINPSKIDIVGKEDVLANINSIDTLLVDINTLIANRNVPVELNIPEGIRLYNPDEKVTVTLNIDETITRTFDYTLSDVEIVNLNRELYIDEEDLDLPFTLTIQGMSSIVESLEAYDIGMELDLDGLEEGNHNVMISVREEEFSVLSILPESLRITLQREE